MCSLGVRVMRFLNPRAHRVENRTRDNGSIAVQTVVTRGVNTAVLVNVHVHNVCATFSSIRRLCNHYCKLEQNILRRLSECNKVVVTMEEMGCM